MEKEKLDKEQVYALIQEYEKIVTAGPCDLMALVRISKPFKKIISLGPNVQYALGAYLHDLKTFEHIEIIPEILMKAWVVLLKKVVKKYKLEIHDLRQNSTFRDSILFFMRNYTSELHNFEREKGNVDYDDRMFGDGTYSFQNSSHLQMAVHHLQYLKESAEKLFDWKVVESCKSQIHQLQAG